MPELAAAVQALAYPNCWAIVEELGNGDRPVAELTRTLRTSQPAVSRHLRLLRQAGLAGSQPVGARHLYRIRSDSTNAVRGHIPHVAAALSSGQQPAPPVRPPSATQPATADHLPGCLDAVDLAGPSAHRRLPTGRSAQLGPSRHAMDCRPRLDDTEHKVRPGR